MTITYHEPPRLRNTTKLETKGANTMKTTTQIEPIDYARFEGHTEGPWETLDEICYTRIEPGSTDAYEMVPLSIGAEGRANIVEIPGTDDTDYANARLIAAAPYLLDQLRVRDAEIDESAKREKAKDERIAKLERLLSSLEKTSAFAELELSPCNSYRNLADAIKRVLA